MLTQKITAICPHCNAKHYVIIDDVDDTDVRDFAKYVKIVVCRKLKVDPNDVTKKSRNASLVFARYIMISLLHKKFPFLTLNEIPLSLGIDFSHCTVMYAYKEIDRIMSTPGEYDRSKIYMELKAEIFNSNL